MLLCLTALYAQRADNYPPTKNAQVKLSETNLPIVFIDVDGKMILREERITAKIKIIDNGTGKTNYADLAAHPDQKVDYEGYISLKYRGNSSFNSSDKKPYGFKTIAKPLEEGGKKVKVSLLGLGKDNDWVLLAPFSDKTMIRDVLTFELGRPYLDWVPSSRHVEVVVDGKYYGIYILTERPGKGKNRLNLHDPGEDGGDLTGDWRVEIDRDDEDHYYRSKYHPYGRYGTVDNTKYIIYQYDDPEYEDFADLPAGTEKAIQKSIDDMEDCFAGDNYKDPVNGYRKYIDVTSSPNKISNMGFCTGLPVVDFPYIFGNCTGSMHDTTVLTPEMGHAYQVWLCMHGQPLPEYVNMPNDAVEIPSKAMEQFTLPFAELFFGRDADKFRADHMQYVLRETCAFCAAYEYEAWLYTHVDATTEERIRRHIEIYKAYQPEIDTTESAGALAQGAGLWRDMGLFMFPAYLVSYALSDVCALELCRRSEEDFAAAWADYRTLCAAGGSLDYPGLMQLAHLPVAYAAGSAKATAAFVRNKLDLYKN
mgnify:CR=1 FL=1